MNKYCTKCGNPLNEGDHFCPKCGTECKEVNTNVSPSIQSDCKKPHNLWEKFSSLPIWAKISYIFAFASFLFLILYSLFCGHHFNYYILNYDYVEGQATCYDDLHFFECEGPIRYYDLHNIIQEVDDAEKDAEDRLNNRFTEVLQITISAVACLIILHIIIMLFRQRLRISKYKIFVYILLCTFNIIAPICIFMMIKTYSGFNKLGYYDPVNRSFLYDIPALIKYANEHNLDTEGKFDNFESNSVKQNNSTSTSNSNSDLREPGKFVYYEDAQEMPQSSSNSYYEDNTNNDRQSEYQEPCRLCGGDGKCFSIRANTSAAMEMYCNGSGVCNHCNGKGYVNNSYLGVDSPMKCTYCNGTGTCQSCHGTGVCQSCHGRGH